MADAPNHAPHLAFTDDVIDEYNRLTGVFMARVLAAGWDAAVADLGDSGYGARAGSGAAVF